jgi:hypothetical protein
MKVAQSFEVQILNFKKGIKFKSRNIHFERHLSPCRRFMLHPPQTQTTSLRSCS